MKSRTSQSVMKMQYTSMSTCSTIPGMATPICRSVWVMALRLKTHPVGVKSVQAAFQPGVEDTLQQAPSSVPIGMLLTVH